MGAEFWAGDELLENPGAGGGDGEAGDVGFGGGGGGEGEECHVGAEGVVCAGVFHDELDAG